MTPEVNLKQAKHIYTVSEITQDIKLILENTFAQVWVEGEISGINKISTGTTFFSLKDANSVIKSVIFPSFRNAIKFEIKDGLKVICFGRISVYEKSGQYQLYVENIEPKGIGSLQLAFEQLKEKLEKEGLFAPEHKKPIPYLPRRIGLVTSAEGAAIKDMLKVLDTRFNNINIILNPVRVQGEGSKDEIAAAIKDFNRFNEGLPQKERVEVLIVGRGGGSIEDLWAFNEEVVARAIYGSRIPIISAVGHERDWTIADMVADLRAPTPSVAAELVVPKKEDLKQQLKDLTESLNASLIEMAVNIGEDISGLIRRLSLNMQHLLELTGEKTTNLARQIYVRIQHLMKLKESGFFGLTEKLSSLSPLNILSRGYSITFKMPQEEIIKDAAGLKVGDTIKTKLSRGEILSQVKGVK